MTRVRKTTPDKTLVIPPKKWRGAASLRGYAGQLRRQIEVAENSVAEPMYVWLEPTTAKALLEIVCQAIHTEKQAEEHGL